MYIQTKVDSPNLVPTRANPTDAGLDLRSKYSIILEKGVRTLVETGVRVKIPVNHVGLLFPRSSLSKQDVIMTNSVGVIDSDYRGEVLASLMYVGPDKYTVLDQLQRIVQLVVVPIALPEPVINTEPDEQWNMTARGVGGFGSSGKS